MFKRSHCVDKNKVVGTLTWAWKYIHNYIFKYMNPIYCVSHLMCAAFLSIHIAATYLHIGECKIYSGSVPRWMLQTDYNKRHRSKRCALLLTHTHTNTHVTRKHTEFAHWSNLFVVNEVLYFWTKFSLTSVSTFSSSQHSGFLSSRCKTLILITFSLRKICDAIL